MSVLYVASDQQGAGKTAFCVTFARKLIDMGKKAVVLKPAADSSQGGDADPDAVLYQKLLGQQSGASSPVQPGGALSDTLISEIKSSVQDAAGEQDVVIIEGSSSLSVQDHKKLADALDAKAVVIARYRRDLSANDLKPWKDALGNRLTGFIVNGLTRYLGNESKISLLPAMQSNGLVSLGIIPENRRLLSSSVGQIAEHLNGRFIINGEYKERLVDHYMAWGFSLDPGELTFSLRENKALVIRGDRPDIQMAALATPTACLISTQGIEPIEYVRYEAEEEEVAIMIVEENTLTTMAFLGSLMDKAQFDHPDKVCAYAELLDEHLDYPTLLSALSIIQ
jgi:hypothetical protein